MTSRLRLSSALLLLPWLLFATVGPHSAAAAPPSATQSWTVAMGHEIFTVQGAKSTWQVNRFYPEAITINAGDSVTWNHESGVEPHTASILGPNDKFPDFIVPECNGAPCPPPPPGAAPGPPPPGVTLKLLVNPLLALKQGGNSYDGTAFVNSGVIAQDLPGTHSYTLSFPKPGTYTFLCLIHTVPLPNGQIVGMQGKVVVQATGSALPKTPDQVVAEGKALMAEDEKEARSKEPDAKRQVVADRPGPNGTTIHQVNTGYEIFQATYTMDYMRFADDNLTINEGDTVEWMSPTPHNFHNVILGEEPQALQIEPQTSGPPKIYANPQVFAPVGDNPGTYKSGSIASAGIVVGSEDPPQIGVQKYSLTFTQSGRYEYLCALHYHNGMNGHVTVNARTGAGNTGGTVGMPRTGTAGNPNPVLITALLFALAGIIGGWRLRRPRKID